MTCKKPEHRALLDQLVEERRSHTHPSYRNELAERDLVRGWCKGFCVQFKARFPELTMVSGFFGSADVESGEPDWSYVEHWWLVEPDGTIVDPTVAQFGGVQGTYTVYDPARHRIRIGRCANCGDDIYGLRNDGPASICGLECQISYMEYVEER